MYKARIATQAIKKALELTNELTCPVSIICGAKGAEVHVLGIANLEAIPGETAYRPLTNGVGSGVEASREYDGVRFYCLMTSAQYEALVS